MRLVTLAALVAFPGVLAAQQANPDSAADRIFATWNSPHSPGCAVAAADHGKTILSKGYGMADLETGTPITPETTFESGSVAKQFTATAAMLLAFEGKLNLDDDVRLYVPELPVYARPILIRHLLSHTSGLREWSNLVALQGWPRGTRVHTQSDLLAVVVAQKNLNYPVGDYYSYTNSGFALLETIVERVSGEPFAQFEAERIFSKLGMTHSSWRDDFTTIVPGRAQAYARRGDGWRLDMPFENVVGPGGLLTTVGDWLIWNDALDHATLGQALVDSLTTQAVLTSGRRIPYARGLIVTNYRGLKEISHSGSTGGYSTYLTRFPERGLSIAILCNAAGAPATQYAHQLVDAIAPDLQPVERPDTVATDPATAERLTGVYRSMRDHQPMQVGDAGLPTRGRGGRGGRGGPPALHALKDGSYMLGNQHLLFDVGANGHPRGLKVLQSDGDTVAYAFVSAAAWKPSAADLQAYAESYQSSELGMTYRVAVEHDTLMVTIRGDMKRPLIPVYRDAFEAPGLGTVWFTRAGARITAMHIGAARVWDIVFARRLR